jgi:hypothetical protein
LTFLFYFILISKLLNTENKILSNFCTMGVLGVAPTPPHRATLFSHKCGAQFGRHTCGSKVWRGVAA